MKGKDPELGLLRIPQDRRVGIGGIREDQGDLEADREVE